MKIILNSKFFSELSVERLGEKAAELGYDGIDLNIRPGHSVDPDNVTEVLPGAIKVWEGQGLVCPLATAPVTMTDPQAPEVERMYAACADSGVPRFKIGFFKYDEGDDYWDVVDAARLSLEGFAKLSERYGVQTCYQIHSGSNIGSNCAGLMHLIRNFPPGYVGAYPDVGHLALDGEDIQRFQEVVRMVPAAEAVVRYAVQLASASRPGQAGTAEFIDQWVNWGAGLRASQNMVLGAKAKALLDGRTHITVEDIQSLAHATMRHRILIGYRAEAEGVSVEKVIDELLQTVPVPTP